MSGGLRGQQLALLPEVQPYWLENWGPSQPALLCSGGELRRPALRYQGGKWLLAPWIAQHFPAHQRYVEPYAGAFSVGLRKVAASETVCNDLNPEVVNFFQQLQQGPEALIDAIAISPRTAAEFERCKVAAGSPLEQARRFYLRCQMAYASGGGRWSGGTSQARLQLVQRQSDQHLWAVAARLQGVAIEQGPALDCLRRHDGPDTLFYVDPPYAHSVRGSKDRRHKSCQAQPRRQYAYELTEADHRELIAILRSLQGAVVLSGYASALYAELLSDWRQVEKTVCASSREPRTECLWMNWGAELAFSPAQKASEQAEAALNVCTIVQPSQRRHSPKGKGCGWLKERQGNTQRKKPTVSYYYCWDEPVKRDGQTEYQWHQVYVPVRAIAQVRQLLAERLPVAVVLDAIASAKLKK